MLELVLDRPDWGNALGVALTRPPGVPERRAGQDPWNPETEGGQKRPRRIADDLAWLRQAYDEPEPNGLRPLHDTAAVGAWEPDEACTERLAPAARAARARRSRLPAPRRALVGLRPPPHFLLRVLEPRRRGSDSDQLEAVGAGLEAAGDLRRDPHRVPLARRR